MYVATQNDARPVDIQDESSNIAWLQTDFGPVLRCDLADSAACGVLWDKHNTNGDRTEALCRRQDQFSGVITCWTRFILVMGIRLYLKWFPCLSFYSLVKASSHIRERVQAVCLVC